MQSIYGGKNVDTLLKNRTINYNPIYINRRTNLCMTVSLSLYKSVCHISPQEVIDITDDMLNKALLVYELTNDFNMALYSLIGENK